MKKQSTITRNIGRCTELKFEWRGWQEKLATSMYLQNPNWRLSSESEGKFSFTAFGFEREKKKNFTLLLGALILKHWRNNILGEARTRRVLITNGLVASHVPQAPIPSLNRIQKFSV